MEVKQRKIQFCESEEEKSSSETSEEKRERESNEIGNIYWICLFVFGFILYTMCVSIQRSCSGSDYFNKDCDDSIEPKFNYSNARTHLKSISRLGRRPTGSIANEIHAPNYILKYLEEIRKSSSRTAYHLEMHVDDQLADLSAFQLNLFGKYKITSVYNKIRNIVVRLHDNSFETSQSDSMAVLFNCHYDSFFDGPGASDDLVSCAVLLEVIRAILEDQSAVLQNDLIFLFNGAEENMLQASHAFITQHKWAANVKLFVNLEAAGSDGRQMIFQTSPRNPWLIDAVSSVIQQPLASVIGQEIFGANLIPSDTDFRIFRDFGQLPGLDIAFITNGYVYHTRHDTEDRISQSCIRHTGENMLRLAVKLANSPHLKNTHSVDSTEMSQKSFYRIVYFDFLGFMLISYSEIVGIIINIGISLLAILMIFVISYSSPILLEIKNTLLGALCHILWLISNIILSIILGFCVHKFGSKMTWYANKYNVIGIYLIPLIWYFFLFHTRVTPKIIRKRTSSELSMCLKNGTFFIFAFVTIILTGFRLLSCYFIAIWIPFLLLDIGLKKLMYWYQFDKAGVNAIYFISNTIAYLIPMAYYFYMIFILYDFFIPVMGRSGAFPSDIIIATLTGIVLSVPCVIFASNVIVTNDGSRRWLLFLLINLTISYSIFVHGTDFGFPYSTSDSIPRKQRIVFNHVTRNIRNSANQIVLSESGIWMVSLDTNKLTLLKKQLQKVVREPMQEVFCELRPYCGYPMILPYSRFVDNSLWLPGRPPNRQRHRDQKTKTVIAPATLIVRSKVTHTSGMVNLTLQLNGPPHSHLYLMTPCSMRVVSWSLGPDPPVPIDMGADENPYYRHYFIFNSYGSRPKDPLSIWITFMPKIDPPSKFPKDISEKQVEIALSAHYASDTPELETVLHLIPRWVTPSTLVSSYEHIVVDFDKNLSYIQ